MNLINEVIGHAKANADAASTADERATWAAHHRSCVALRAEFARLLAALKELADASAIDLNRNQDGDAGGWWSLRTENAIRAARVLEQNASEVKP